jgi:acyl carrier protein
MIDTELIQRLNAAIAEEFEVEASSLERDASIMDTLELDSLSLVDLVAVIERETGVKLKGMEVKEIQTFGNLYDYIGKNL